MTISLPQPGQTRVIEASAGTGKTWAISDLACRFIVGQAVPIAQLAIVTFTSAAVTEVRGRTQERLRRCAAMLTDPDPSHTNMDDESDSLWSDDPDLRRQRRDRARAALADFDHAAIMTTHGFCDHLLSLLGVLADHDQSDTLVTDLTAMITTTVADHYAQTCRTGDPRFSYEEALSWSKAALFAPSAAIVPTDRPEAAFIETVRRSVEVKKRRAGVYTFDDMLLRCRASLINPVTAQLARRRLSDAYPVLLVDEFQDTDSIQWDIIRAGFVDASTVVLIGDPKQSIYNFRGADVSAYLTATRTAQTDTLDVNHRSSPSVVEAVASLTVGLELGDPRITVKPVRTSMDTPSLVADVSESCGPWGLPLRLRVPADLTPRSVDEARRLIDADLISDLRALLDRGPSYRGSPIDPPRALRPDDVAILVATNSRGRLLLDRLAQAGVPAVFTGSGSVFDTDAARDWELLLRAVESSTASRVRAASLTTIFGWTIDDLVHLDPERFVDLSSVIRRLGPLLADHGAMTIHQWLIEHTDIERRVHASADGERYLADFRHVAHLLNGPRPVFVSPLEWLSSRRLDGPMSDDTSRRSPTQADAVRILTIHQAKGLQFPIVYLPQLADHHQQVPPPRSPVVTSDLHGDRVVDLGLSDQSSPTRGPGPNRDDAETLRSAYVGLTRATTHITTWWLPTTANTETSALHRLLFRDGPAPASRISLEGADPRRLTIPGLTVETMPPDQPVGPAAATPVSPGAIDPSQASPPPAQTPPRLRRRLNRPIDQDWRRTSFSALTASAHHDVRADDHGVDADSVSRSLATTTTADDHDPQLDQLSPMAELPGGAAFGSLVHTVFEHADPAAGSLADTVAAAMTTSGFLELPPEELTKTLSAGLTTPLGSIADGLSLAEIPLSDRLAELSFELPLGRGQEAVSLPDIARSLRQHLSADDPLHEYPSHLESADLDQRALRGYLSGAIDVVLRVNGRYLIVDYKTNRLGAPGTPLTLRSYTMPGLTQAMIASHYPLQALLYAVALHRFLRWRLPGYDPGHHLGGIAYLFVRGMAGPATPTQDGAVCGVFPWRPPHRLITGLSDQLAGVQS